jgi:hypothetical protein
MSQTSPSHELKEEEISRLFQWQFQSSVSIGESRAVQVVVDVSPRIHRFYFVARILKVDI